MHSIFKLGKVPSPHENMGGRSWVDIGDKEADGAPPPANIVTSPAQREAELRALRRVGPIRVQEDWVRAMEVLEVAQVRTPSAGAERRVDCAVEKRPRAKTPWDAKTASTVGTADFAATS